MIELKNEHGKVVHRLFNFERDTLELFGEENLINIQLKEELKRAALEKSGRSGYPPWIRVFSIDNNGSLLHCTALVYSAPVKLLLPQDRLFALSSSLGQNPPHPDPASRGSRLS